jgi:hypothetical protein
VVHGTDKFAGPSLLVFTLALRAVNAVAGLGRRRGALLEEFLLLARLVLVWLSLLLLRRGLLYLLLGLLLRLLHLARLSLRRTLLARLVFAAATAAAMPLRRRLTVVRHGPHFRLGLG